MSRQLPHSQANLQADRRAYTELMKHLRQIDGNHHTVILMQVRNELGLRFSPRDCCPQATHLFNSSVPEKFVLQKKDLCVEYAEANSERNLHSPP